jgi:hypothetical protein
VAGSFEHGNKHSDFVKYGEFLDQLKDFSFSELHCYMQLGVAYSEIRRFLYREGRARHMEPPYEGQVCPHCDRGDRNVEPFRLR